MCGVVCKDLGLPFGAIWLGLYEDFILPSRPVPSVAAPSEEPHDFSKEGLEGQSSTSWTLQRRITKSFQYLEESTNWIM